MNRNLSPAHIGLVSTLLILVAVAARLAPHPINFGAVGAVALFSGYYFRSPRFSWMVPMTAMLVSNVLLGGYDLVQMVLVNAAIVLPAFFGHHLHRDFLVTGPRWLRSLARLGAFVGASLGGSALFFVFSNLAVWGFSGMYAHTIDGLLYCYLVALPFIQQDQSRSMNQHSCQSQIKETTTDTDTIYNGFLFGGLAIVVTLREPRPAAAPLAA